MYFDQPHDRLRPGPETRELLEMYAVQAGIALNHAQQRERLREQMWLAGMVHSVIETTDGRFDLDQCLDSALSTLRIELGAVAAWLDIFPGDEPPVEGRCPSRSPVHKVMAAVGAHGPSLARDCLRRGEALVLDRVGLAEGHRLFTSAQATTLLGAMEAEGVQSLVLTPLPANEDVAGQLVLMRSSPHPWTPAERVAVRDMVASSAGRSTATAAGDGRPVRTTSWYGRSATGTSCCPRWRTRSSDQWPRSTATCTTPVFPRTTPPRSRWTRSGVSSTR
jgi:GAF domain-containing protein